MPLPKLETEDVTFMRRQFAAWMEGVAARFLDIPLADCPHPARSAEGDAYENGWEIVNQGLKDQSFPTSCKQRIIESLLKDWIHIGPGDYGEIDPIPYLSRKSGWHPLVVEETMTVILGNKEYRITRIK